MKNKYRNKIVYADGLKFDSIIERDRYFFLKYQEKQGLITELECQKKFDIVVNRKKVCTYVADFVYNKKWVCDTRPGAVNSFWVDQLKLKDAENYLFVIEDVKSPISAKEGKFRLKKKLFEAVYGVEIKIIQNSALPV